MASLKPTLVNYPLFCTDICTLSARAGSTAATAATSTAAATAKDSQALLQTSTGIPSLPSAFDSPLATYKEHTPAVAILALIMIIILTLFLSIAFCYFIFLRFRGKCSQCPHYEDELKKWKNGSLKPITREIVYDRPHNCDLEKGIDTYGEKGVNPFDDHVSPLEDQAKHFKALQRAQSLASLEGRGPYEYQEKKTVGDRALRHLRTSQLRAAKVQRDSGWASNVVTIDEDEEPKDFEKEKEEVKRTAMEFDVQEPAPAHLPRRATDDQITHVNEPAIREPALYEEYERTVIAERERQKKVQSITGWFNVANDPDASDAKKERALAMASAKMVQMDEDEGRIKETAAAPRERGHSRFQERFSLATQS